MLPRAYMRRTINSEEAELDRKDKAWKRTNDKGLSDPHCRRQVPVLTSVIVNGALKPCLARSRCRKQTRNRYPPDN